MEHNTKQHHPGYLTFVFVWLALLALTSITVTIAGVSLGKYTLFIALTIAAIKSALVINIFMHIKFEEKLFKVFIALSGLTLLVIFALTFFDFLFR